VVSEQGNPSEALTASILWPTTRATSKRTKINDRRLGAGHGPFDLCPGLATPTRATQDAIGNGNDPSKNRNHSASTCRPATSLGESVPLDGTCRPLEQVISPKQGQRFQHTRDYLVWEDHQAHRGPDSHRAENPLKPHCGYTSELAPTIGALRLDILESLMYRFVAGGRPRYISARLAFGGRRASSSALTGSAPGARSPLWSRKKKTQKPASLPAAKLVQTGPLAGQR
jgi:hypothetical protein